MQDLQKVPQKGILAQYSKEEVQLIKNTYAKGATDDELKMFLLTCHQYKLNPILSQIHFVKRKTYNINTKAYEEIPAIQVGVGGFRTIAERTGNYAGSDEPEYGEEIEITYTTGKDQYEKKNKIMVPSSAKVTVYKMVQGQRCAFTHKVKWNEYYVGEKQGFMWHKMPENQLAKCAESGALRKAFPDALSGLYTDEEMEQAKYVDVHKVEDQTEDVIKIIEACTTLEEYAVIAKDINESKYQLSQTGFNEVLEHAKKKNNELKNKEAVDITPDTNEQ